MSRCSQCKKKLGIQEYKCKCEKIFCINHLHFMEHNCEYDYKVNEINLLKEKMNVGILREKIEKI